MLRQALIVAKQLAQDSPILEALVDGLLSVSHTLLHGFSLFWIGNALWALDVPWSLTNATIVGFDTLKLTQERQKRVSEDGDVRPLARRKWTILIFKLWMSMVSWVQ